MITIDLPFPPSVNAIWRKNARTVHRSGDYVAWQNEAGKKLLVQKPGRITGRYHLAVYLRRPDQRRRDLGNFEKGLSDLLVAHRIVEDDCLSESILLTWTDDKSMPACRVVVAPAEEQSDSRLSVLRRSA